MEFVFSIWRAHRTIQKKRTEMLSIPNDVQKILRTASTRQNPIKYYKFTCNLCKCIDIAEIIIFMNVSIGFGCDGYKQMTQRDHNTNSNEHANFEQTCNTHIHRVCRTEQRFAWFRNVAHLHSLCSYQLGCCLPKKDNPIIQ